MIIRRALPHDVDTILAWRRERTAWLARQGLDQWSTPLPRTAVSATVLAGQTWIVTDDQRPVATITLSAWTDLEDLWTADTDQSALWTTADQPSQALYAAKMIVPRSASGHGIGAEMLSWAGGLAYDAGLTWLRLDAWTTNLSLHAYYAGLGFQLTRLRSDRLSGALFQRPAQPYEGPLKTDE